MNEFELKISDLSPHGPGVARDSENCVVFVPFTMPGDHVLVQVVEKSKRFKIAKVTRWLEESPDRMKSPCSVFGDCGGCQWHHVPYEIQWKTKSKGVLEGLKRVGIECHPSRVKLEEFPADLIWNYRNRIQIIARNGKAHFHRNKSKELVEIQRCEIAQEALNVSMSDLKGRPSSKPQQVELEIKDGQVVQSWNQGHGALGFRQIHDDQNDLLCDWLRGRVGSSNWLLDLYGGSGNFSFALKDQFKKVDCVDLQVSRERASESVHFHEQSVRSWLQKKMSLRQGDDQEKGVAIIDPPRKGLGHDAEFVAGALQALGVTKVVLVGCEASAWAKDLASFRKKGWELTCVALFDFFPQTYRIESVAVLSL